MCVGEARGTPAALFASALELCAAQKGHDVKVEIVDGTVTATYLGISQQVAVPDQNTECVDEVLLTLRQTTYERYFAKRRRWARLKVLRNSGTVFEVYSSEHKASVDLDWSNFRSEYEIHESFLTAGFAAELVRMALDKGVGIDVLATDTTAVATHKGVKTTFALDDILDFDTATLLSRICPGL
jgi:hypothetical protein